MCPSSSLLASLVAVPRRRSLPSFLAKFKVTCSLSSLSLFFFSVMRLLVTVWSVRLPDYDAALYCGVAATDGTQLGERDCSREKKEATSSTSQILRIKSFILRSVPVFRRAFAHPRAGELSPFLSRHRNHLPNDWHTSLRFASDSRLIDHKDTRKELESKKNLEGSRSKHAAVGCAF